MGMHIGPPITGGTHRTYTSSGIDYGIWTFTSSDTFITNIEISCSVLIVGAGGGGQHHQSGNTPNVRAGGNGSGGLVRLQGAIA